MLKDYISISQKKVSLNEADFVENYWTNIWNGENLQDITKAQIEQREEFKIMNPYLTNLHKCPSILDGGCGLGYWTLYYQSRGYNIVGLDISHQTIERLKTKFPNSDFRVGDIRKTNFTDNYFDAYFSWGTFEHFENGLGDCIREANRILKPSGFLFISVPYHNWRHIIRNSRALHCIDKTYDRQKGYAETKRFYQWRLTIPELERELAIERFKILDIHPIGREQGVQRMLVHDLPIQSETWLDRLITPLFNRTIPTRLVGHMLLAIAQKI